MTSKVALVGQARGGVTAARRRHVGSLCGLLLRRAYPRESSPLSARAMVMFFAWTSSPTNSISFFMVCLLLVGLTIGDAAPAVLPQRMRRCTVLPCNPRIRQSFKHTTFPFRKRCAPRIGSHKV